MFLFSKKDIIKKVILASLSVCLIAVAIITAIRQIQNHVTAVTSEGDTVNVVKGESIKYGSWGTGRFTITIDNQAILGFCANPKRKPSIGDFPAVVMPESNDNNLIKLMAYISTNDNSITRPIMNDFFSTITDEDLRYAYSHAVIGAIYDNDYKGLGTSERNMVDGIIVKLQSMINNNHDAWIIANNYILYNIDRSDTSYQGDDYQDIIWIEGDFEYGKIKVEKHDSKTGSTVPQGNADLENITFEVYNNTGSRIYNPKKDKFYNDGALVESKKTGANGTVTFSDLTLGSYLVKETRSNATYKLTSTEPQEVIISSSGETIKVVFEDDVKTGSIIVDKKDIELGSCNQLGKANFSGIKFQLINNSANPIIYNDSSIAVGGVVLEKELDTSECKVSFGYLPYGSYKVKEVGSGTGYLANETIIDVTIPVDGDSPTAHPHVNFENQVIRGDVKFRKVDQDGQVMANIPFRITSKTTGESHIVITDLNGIVNTSASVNLHSNHTNGYDNITNFSTTTYQGYGTWFGKSASSSDIAAVNDTLGALPYDSYEISEVSCDQNQLCADVESEKQIFDVTSNNVVIDLGDWENLCVEVSLSTNATDNDDGDKFIPASTQVKIKDSIDYCLKAGLEFTIEGVLMHKKTNLPVLTDRGALIKESVTFTPTSDCGKVTMVFTIDSSLLAGQEIVVFEKVYRGSRQLIAHEDINDAAQTVSVINFSTFAENGEELEIKPEEEESEEEKDGEEEGDKEEEEEEEVDAEIIKKHIESTKNAKIKDTISYCLKPNTEFTFKGTLMDKTTGEALTVNGEKIESSVDITTTDACGEVEMFFEIDASSLLGHDLVVFEKLYHNNQLILSHEDINDEKQTVYLVSLTTFATNSENGSKDVISSGKVVIRDVVKYYLRAGLKYKVRGILMDKKNKKPLLVNGETIEQTITFTPENNSGETEMLYEFDATGLGDMDIVIFEDVYLGETLLIRHEDFENLDETFYLLTKVPDTGFLTKAENGSDEQNRVGIISVIFIAVPIVVYSASRIRNKKKIFDY